MLKGVIDRFEGNYAIIELGGVFQDFPLELLPKEAKEGDAVLVEGNQITIDNNETLKTQQKVKTLMDEIWED